MVTVVDAFHIADAFGLFRSCHVHRSEEAFMAKRSFLAALKTTTSAVLVFAMLFAIAGCSPEQNDRGTLYQHEILNIESESASPVKTETPYTLFVDNDERSVWYLVGSTSFWGKDADASVYVFEQGKITKFGNYEMSVGSIAKLNDDQVIAKFEEAISQSEFSEIETEEVALHIVTDKTGNNVEREFVSGISNSFDSDIENGQYSITSAMNEPLVIYDTKFAGYRFYTNSGYTGYFVTKTDGSTLYSLDNLGDYDIPVD